MKLFKRFTKLMKSETEKKSFGWTVSENKILSVSDIKQLRNACQNFKDKGIRQHKFFSVRDWFMIELGLFTGLRVNEMRQLRVEDLLINDNQSSVFVRNGKGGRKRSVWINEEFKIICQEFLKLRSQLGLNNDNYEHLLSSAEGTSITKRSLQKAFKRCINKSGLSDKYSIHCLRHTYGTFLLKASQNIKLVKEQLGHASIKTTEIYISLINEDRREALESLYGIKALPYTRSKRKGRGRIKHISCETLVPGTLKRRSYRGLPKTVKGRLEELAKICDEIMTENKSKQIESYS